MCVCLWVCVCVNTANTEMTMSKIFIAFLQVTSDHKLFCSPMFKTRKCPWTY